MEQILARMGSVGAALSAFVTTTFDGAAGAAYAAAFSPEHAFEFGLQRVLDGVEALVSARGGQTRRAAIGAGLSCARKRGGLLPDVSPCPRGRSRKHRASSRGCRGVGPDRKHATDRAAPPAGSDTRGPLLCRVRPSRADRPRALGIATIPQP
jgi:hypothetical protein